MDNVFVYIIEKIMDFLSSDLFAWFIVTLLMVGLVYNFFNVLALQERVI